MNRKFALTGTALLLMSGSVAWADEHETTIRLMGPADAELPDADNVAILKLRRANTLPIQEGTVGRVEVTHGKATILVPTDAEVLPGDPRIVDAYGRVGAAPDNDASPTEGERLQRSCLQRDPEFYDRPHETNAAHRRGVHNSAVHMICANVERDGQGCTGRRKILSS